MSTRALRIFEYTAITVILVLAFFFRTWQIDTIPYGLYPDEAVNAADAFTALDSGNFQLFYPNNQGREGLFINLQALAIHIFGNEMWALKLWSAIFGTLAVFGVYLLGSELFRRRAAGLFAAFFLAFSYWGINFSRIGFRAIMTTFILSFSFYFLFRGIRTSRKSDFIWGGLFFGLGLHTYIAYRLAPFILIAGLPFLALSYEHFFRRFGKNILIFTFAAFVAALPMLHYFYTHPDEFASRSGNISIFSPDINHGNIIGTFAKTFGLSLIKYNFVGDQNWRHNYPPYAILDPITGAFFLSGFLFLLWQLIHLLFKRFRDGVHDWRITRNAFLLISFFVMLAPEFLTGESLPHALRGIGTQMSVFLMAALPGLWILDRANKSAHGAKIAAFTLIFLSLSVGASINLVKYFVFFAESPRQLTSFNASTRNIAEYFLSLPDDVHKYVVTNDRSKIIGNQLPINVQPIVFFTHDKVKDITYLLPDSDEMPIKRGSIIALIDDDTRVIGNIQKYVPEAYSERVGNTDADTFTLIHIP